MNAARALSLLVLVPLFTAPASCGSAEDELHSTVRLEFLRAKPEENPFEGTVKMQVLVRYETCLQDFYTTEANEWAQNGPEGGPVFQEWVDRLCDPGVNPDTPECEVDSINQNLGAQGSSKNLRVVYNMTGSDLSLQKIAIGPLPTEALTGNCVPEVVIDSGSVLGFNASEEVIWTVASFDANNRPIPGESAAVKVKIQSSIEEPAP